MRKDRQDIGKLDVLAPKYATLKGQMHWQLIFAEHRAAHFYVQARRMALAAPTPHVLQKATK